MAGIFGQPEAALDTTVETLGAMNLGILRPLRTLALRLDHQAVILDPDVDRIVRHSRELKVEVVAVRVFRDIHRGNDMVARAALSQKPIQRPTPRPISGPSIVYPKFHSSNPPLGRIACRCLIF